MAENNAAALSTDIELIDAFCAATEEFIHPLLAKGTSVGDQIFGGAIFEKKTLKLITYGANDSANDPLIHGETATIHQFFKIPKEERPKVRDCVFFTTHEPCPLCLSSITWAGFNNWTTLFTYEESAEDFICPEDIEIHQEVFKHSGAPRPWYNKENKFWVSQSVKEMLERVADVKEKERLEERVKKAKGLWDGIKASQQKGKDNFVLPWVDY